MGEQKANFVADVEFHWEGDWNPFLKTIAEMNFMKVYNEYTNTFNEHISEINAAFDKLHPNYGSLSEEDGTQQEYNQFVKWSMQPYIRELNKSGMVTKITRGFTLFTIDMDDECQFRLVCPNGAYVYITMEFVRWLN